MRKIGLISVVVVLLLLTFVVAAPTGGVTTKISSERGTSTTFTNQTIEGGNVTLINVTAKSISSNWGGFFGNISGSISLEDASSNVFYRWTASNLTNATVYAANTTTTFSDVVAGNSSVQPSYIVGARADNWTQTLDNSAIFSSESLGPIASTPYVDTYNSTGDAVFRTWSLFDNVDQALIYAATAVDDTAGFDGSTYDFQLLVPANTEIQYTFYLELP